MSVPRGAQRVALVLLSLALAAASFGAYQQAGKASDELATEATTSAERAAGAIGPTLSPEDLEGPVGGERYQTISSFLDGIALGPDEFVTVLNRDAVVVFAQDRDSLGQKHARGKVARVLSIGTQTELRGGTFSVFVPVTVGEASEIAIIDISRPSQAIEAAQRPWIIVAVAAGILALMVLVFAFSRSAGRSAGFGDAISPSRVLDIERRHEKEMAGLEKTLERARADEAGVRAELDKVAEELGAHKKVLTELDEAVNKAESRAVGAEGQLADAHKRITEAEARADHAESGEGEARARITAAESRANDAERQTAEANARARQAEEWAEDLAALGDDLERAGSGNDEEFKQLRSSLLEAKRQAASARDAKRDLADRVATLESTNRALDAERETLATERRALDSERQELVAEREALERARASAEDEAAVAREELQHAQQQLDHSVATSKAQLATARRELEEGGAELAAARRELEAARSREAEMSARVEEAKTDAERARAEVEQATAETERARAAADSAAAETEVARLAGQAKSAQLTDATDRLASLQREADETAEQLREQTERAGTAEAKVVEMFHQVQELQQRPDLSRDLEGARAEITALQTSLAASNEHARTLEGELALARSETEAAEHAGAEVSERLSEQLARTDEESSKVAQLTERIGELEARPDLTAELAAARKVGADLSSLLEAEKKDRADLTARMEGAEQASADLKAELEAAKQVGADLTERLEAARKQGADFTSELEGAKREGADLAAELETATREGADLAADLEASRTEVDELTRRIAELEARPDFTDDLDTSRRERASLAAKVEVLTAELANTLAELESTRAAVGETEAGGHTLREELRTARAEAQTRKQEGEGLRTELENVMALLERTKVELEATRAAAGQTEAEQRTLQEQLRTRSEEAEARRREDEGLRAELEKARAEEERLRTELETWRVEVDGLRAQTDLQQAEADGLRAESESIRAGAHSLRSESVELLQEKDRLIEQLQSSEWAVGQERARAEELARRQAELQAHADDVARKAAEEAIAARGRLLETQETLARFQSELEEVATNSVSAADVGLDAEGVQGVVDALSTDAKRSLSAIFGLARMMSTQGPTPEEGRLLQQLMSQARRMEHALADILDAERLARGEVILKRRSTEIDTLVRRVVREFPLTDGRQVDVLVDTATIQIDPARLERLVDDLLTSAMARTPRGERIVLRLERTSDGVMLAVEGGASSGVEVGPAATFLAKLHGGWTSAEALPGGRGVARIFLPSVWPVAADQGEGSDPADATEAADPDPDATAGPTDHAEATA